MFPPIEAYAVNFANGNLQPHLNPYGWPDFRLSQQVPGAKWAVSDAQGISLNCRTTAPAAGNEPFAMSLYLVLPEPSPSVVGPRALPTEVRALLRVTFDLPYAKALDGSSPFKEAWGISANLRIDRQINGAGAQQLDVTSQFVEEVAIGMQTLRIDGVRLNTPRSLQQVDQARRLDGPLEYARYQPFGCLGVFLRRAPVFTLEHAFCGYAAQDNGHTPGSGMLKIRFPFWVEKCDYRVYSSTELLPLPAGSTIGAVGVSVATVSGVGTFGARLRSFRLWLDQELTRPSDPSMFRSGTTGPS